jgi:4-amino-4-deoxy-L-arabinose transferase-like glycosyltransferase
MLLSPTLGIDDVQEAMFAQTWELGYDPEQPPLYTWLLLAVFKLVGVNLFGLTLLRYACMFFTFLYSLPERTPHHR